MNSIGTAHADRFLPRCCSHVSTPDRMLFIIGLDPGCVIYERKSNFRVAEQAGHNRLAALAEGTCGAVPRITRE